MPLNIPVGYALAVVSHAVPFAGQTQLCTFGVQVNIVDPEPNAIASVVASCWAGSGLAFSASAVADSTRFTGVKVYYQSEIGLQLGEDNDIVDGTRTSQPPSPQVACITKKRTALVGRRYRGRMYLPASFLVATDVGPSGIIATTPLGLLQARMNATLDALADDDVPMVLFHTESPFTATPVTNLVVESLIGTQRRRVR